MSSMIQLAYLDPGSGSLLLQAIVGGTAGVMVFFRHWWRTFRASKSANAPSDVVR